MKTTADHFHMFMDGLSIGGFKMLRNVHLFISVLFCRATTIHVIEITSGNN